MDKNASLGGIIIAFILVSMLAISISVIVGEMNQKYPVYDTTLTSGFNNLERITNQTEDMRSQVQSNSTSILDVVGFTTKGSISVVTLSLGTIDTAREVLGRIETKLQLPAGIIVAVGTILFITLILIIASAIFRYQLGGG